MDAAAQQPVLQSRPRMTVDRDLRLPPDATGAPEEDTGGELDLAAIRDYASFVLGAPRRHKALSIIIFVLILAATRVLVWALPRTYHVESTLLAQKNTKIAAIALGDSSGGTADAPTRLVTETVLRRDNLVALVQKTGLVKSWEQSRAPIHQLKDWMMGKLGRIPSEADKAEALVGTLEGVISVRLDVDWQGEGTLTFAVDWPSPLMAYKLAVAAQQNFLESRHMSETENISEAISLMETRTEAVRSEIDALALKIDAATAARGEAAQATAEEKPEPAARRRPRTAVTAPDTTAIMAAEASRAEAASVKAEWESKKAAIRELEDGRQRRLLELQGRLTEQRVTYSDSHPIVADTRRTIEMFSQPSSQVVQLRQEAATLEARYHELTGGGPDGTSSGLALLLQARPTGGRSGSALERRSMAAAAAPSEDDDRPMEFLRAQLRMQMQSYDRLMERIDAARWELDAAEVAFKYRYTLIRPAQMPSAPSKPNITLVGIGGILAAFLFALLAAVIADFRRARILERWQVERMLDLPVLAEMRGNS
jgi:hypothetical protein